MMTREAPLEPIGRTHGAAGTSGWVPPGSGEELEVVKEDNRIHERLLRPAEVIVAVQPKPREATEPAPWDAVDQASWESFPASDAPPWTLGYTG